MSDEDLFMQAATMLHKGEYQKVINIITKNVYKQKNVTQEDIAYGNIILGDALFAMSRHADAQELVEKSIVHPAVQNNQAYKTKYYRALHYYITRLYPKIVEVRPWILLPGYNFMNASLLCKDNVLISFIRATNYTKRDRKEVRNDNWQRILSRNFVYMYDCYFRVLFHKEIEDTSIWPRNLQSPVVGYEDPRIVYYNNTYYFTATSFECTRILKPAMVLCELDTSSWNVIKTIQLQCQDMNDMQKNWLPFVDHKTNKFLVIYRFSPFIVNEINVGDGSFKEIVRITLPHIHFPTVRGSTSPVPFDNGWLFVIHFVNYDNASEDIYYSRFVWMTYDFIPKKMSATFTLEHFGLEYISGLAILNDAVYITYNIQDIQSKLSRISVNILRSKIKWYDVLSTKETTFFIN